MALKCFWIALSKQALAVSDLYNSDLHEGRRYADIKLTSGRGSFRVNFPDTINNSASVCTERRY